jgi:hypothetical protein
VSSREKASKDNWPRGLALLFGLTLLEAAQLLHGFQQAQANAGKACLAAARWAVGAVAIWRGWRLEAPPAGWVARRMDGQVVVVAGSWRDLLVHVLRRPLRMEAALEELRLRADKASADAREAGWRAARYRRALKGVAGRARALRGTAIDLDQQLAEVRRQAYSYKAARDRAAGKALEYEGECEELREEIELARAHSQADLEALAAADTAVRGLRGLCAAWRHAYMRALLLAVQEHARRVQAQVQRERWET